MKIIKNTLDKVKPYIFNCDECNSKLEASPSDFKYKLDQRDGDALICRCPVCKKDNWIDISLFTQAFRSKVKR